MNIDDGRKNRYESDRILQLLASVVNVDAKSPEHARNQMPQTRDGVGE